MTCMYMHVYRVRSNGACMHVNGIYMHEAHVVKCLNWTGGRGKIQFEFPPPPGQSCFKLTILFESLILVGSLVKSCVGCPFGPRSPL